MKIEELIKGRWYTCNWNWNHDKPLTFLVDYVNTEDDNIFVTKWITPNGPSNSGGFDFKKLSNIRPCYSPELQKIIDREMPIDRPYRDSIKLVENLSSEHQEEIEGDTPENKSRTLLLEEAKRRFPMGSTYKSPSGNNQFVDFDFEWQNNGCISKLNKGLAYGKLSGWATLVEYPKQNDLDNRKPAPKQDDLDDCSFTYKPDDLSFVDKMEGAMISKENNDLRQQISMADHLMDAKSYIDTSVRYIDPTIDQYVVLQPTELALSDFNLQYPRTEKEAFKQDITIIRPSKRKILSTDIPSTSVIKESIKHNK